ncbi:TM2 domain-containing protein [Paenibacillus sinopodophylli]|uniref:TM2 domain-containing protein n=1 Tax=Paenibacillus sinopodophylli TaxID=1837342 RepID=UPI00110CC6BA|nr:TM2 domain-containing protein [Paenibacillus sinopodophylli]
MEKSSKSFIAALLFCLFLGGFSIHRFYVGKVGTAILQIITLGGLGIWLLIDLIMIIVGKFTDSEGKRITA